MAFTVSKNPSQQFQYQKGMDTLAGKTTSSSHSGHLHTDGMLSKTQFGQQIQPASMYTNVAMQMTPPSLATNTASGTKA